MIDKPFSLAEIKKIYESATAEDWKHLEEVPKLREIFQSSKQILQTLKSNKHQVAVFTQKVNQTLIITDALVDMHECMLHSLENRLFYAVDPLARIGLEHAVNLIYILRDESGQRTNALSSNFIKTTAEKSERWLKSVRKGGDADEIAVAKSKLEHFAQVAHDNESLLKKAPTWPNTFERFSACGFENAYRTIYSMNSDSVHCLSEDMFNLGTISKYPAQLRQAKYQQLQSQNASLSVYLFIKTLAFFILGLSELSNSLKNEECNEELSKLGEILGELIELHEEETVNRILPT